MSIKLNNYITDVMKKTPEQRAALWAVCNGIARPLPDVYMEVADLHQRFNDFEPDDRVALLHRMVAIVAKVARELADAAPAKYDKAQLRPWVWRRL